MIGYCEYCEEENITIFEFKDIRPVSCFCSKDCCNAFIGNILDGDWQGHFKDDEKKGYVENELIPRIKKIGYNKWFDKNWNKKD